MERATGTAIDEWHRSVNAGDLAAAARAVGDPVVVLGPRGAASITPAQFAEWVQRSGIRLVPRAWHPVGDRLVVVEQDASWPGSVGMGNQPGEAPGGEEPGSGQPVIDEPVRVATVFRVAGGKVTAALRLPDLRSALELAQVHRELLASEEARGS